MPLGMLGKYERLDVLGHGASGIVYLAKDTLLGRMVALKEISAQGDEKERVLGEARVLDRLRHPNIVQVVGVDEIGGKVVIAMEYVRGRSLLDILRDQPQLPLSDAASIVAQVCDGLAFAHAHRTVHRDVKPANILVSDDGVVKLVDFGLAEVLGTHSLAGGAGTYAYMAPEDFHEQEQSGRQSDIWAAGVVLYETLAGRRPFQVTRAKDPFAWKRAIEDDPLPPLLSFRPDAPPALAEIAARALARDRTVRYADATEMADALRALPLPASSLSAAGNISLPSEIRPPAAPLPALLGAADIDGFLLVAPDDWDDACDALTEGQLSAWLDNIGEPPLARVAADLSADTERDAGDRLRDFLYRAGLETVPEARRAFAEGERALRQGRPEDALPGLRRAVRLDPSPVLYQEKLDAAFRALNGDMAEDPEVVPAMDDVPSRVTLQPEYVDFGALRQGQSRSVRVMLRGAGRGVVQGRVASAPGWVRVEPPVFATRQRQPLTLTADTAALWPQGQRPAPAAFEDFVVIDLGGERCRIPVRANLLPARRGFWQIAFWYTPLLLCCLLPALAGAAAPFLAQMTGTTHNHLHQLHNLWQPGFAASGLLCGALFVLSSAADTVWPLRLVPLGLLCLLVGRFAAIAPNLGNAREELARAALVQTAIPILVLLGLQTAASSLDPHRWGRWQVWRWIVGATALLVTYALLHIG